MRIRAAGAFALDDAEADRILGRGQARELLGVLTANRGMAVDTPAVIEALWGPAAPATAATIVHGAVARIRKALGSAALVRTDAGYLLDPSLVTVDLWELDEHIAAGRLAEARAQLVEPLYGPYAQRQWAAPTIAALREQLGRGGATNSTSGTLRAGGAPVTRLIGRRRELAALRAAHGRSRLVTIVGLGGVGKSRLVSELAGELSTSVARVDLGLASGSFAVRLAAALDTVASRDRGADLLGVAAVLHDTADVLVLDGCEHDLDGAADGVAFLLQRCLRLSVLATSRVALGLPGEQVIPLLPFSDPGDPLGDGVELVLDRVRALGLPLDPDDRQRAAAICVRCAGVPLAIELAADEVLGGIAQPHRADPPGTAVRAVIGQTLANLAPATSVAARRAALLPAGVTPALLNALHGGGAFAARELLVSGLAGVEGAGGRRRVRFPDSVRAVLLADVDAADLEATSGALTSVGARSRPRIDEPPVLASLADAIAEITNANGLLDTLAAAGRHDEQLELALAFGTPWREDGHWASGSAALERALADAEAHGPLEPGRRAEVVLHIVTVAGTYEIASRMVDELDRAAADALAVGRPEVATALRVHQANGLGYAGRIHEAAAALAAARQAADASSSPTIRLYPDVTEALGYVVAGQPLQAWKELAALAERCASLGAHSDAARVGRLGAIAARAAGALAGALAQAEIAEEQAIIGLARGTLAVVRSEIADIRFSLDPGAAGPSLEASLESALAAGQLRTVGVCRLRLGLLAGDLPAIAGAAVELLTVDGRWAGLGLAHVLGRLEESHPLSTLIPSAITVLEGWGSPLGADDTALVRAAASDAAAPPEGWESYLVGALLEL